MSGTAVLLCGGTGLTADAFDCARAVVVRDLCSNPAAAAATLRELAATRVVLVLCEHGPSGDLVNALQRAGASTFGIESIVAGGREPAEVALLVAGLVARLDALSPGDTGKPVLASKKFSRLALLQLTPVVTHVPVAVVDEAACVGSARCGVCADACPERAIDVSSRQPLIDITACTACGGCVPSCPHAALRLAGSSTGQIEAQLEQLLPAAPGIVFACRSADVDAPPGWPVVELPTLRLVSPGWLLQVRAHGVEARLAPCAGPCCSGVLESGAFAAGLLNAIGEPRRTEPARVHLAEPLATVDAVRRLAPRDTAVVLEGASSPLGVLALAPERCTLCGACTTACPTNALQLRRDADEVVLCHEPSACFACGRCAVACPEDALSVERAVDIARLNHGTLELVSAQVEPCADCGRELPPLPLRSRLRGLLPSMADAPLDLCAECAARSTYDQSHLSTERKLKWARQGPT
jgi:ferredoxin